MSKRAHRWWTFGAVLTVLAGLYLAFGAAVGIAALQPQHADCFAMGEAPQGATADENSSHQPHQHIVWAPIGLRCSYFAGDNAPRIVRVYDDWPTTIAASTSVLLLGAGIVGLIALRRPRRFSGHNSP